MAKAIQICGTGSGVGKSVITSALCRIFLEDGYSVAPFKSQNMALNSFVTADGREIARAQSVQAQACRIAPSSDMNPILIKPSSDTKAQIILQGRPVGNMSVYKYKAYKKLVFDKVKASLKRLQNKYEVIVIEGAGSPAEVNLKSHDLVNLKIAALAKAPVILVGDIDKGGVLASLVGTLQLLTPKERKMIKGFIINKFRGDLRLFRSGVTFLEKYTGIKVLGVVPYLKDVKVPEEDSVPIAPAQKKSPSEKRLKIAVIYLPHISNFTDFDALAQEEDVRLTYARSCQDLHGADAIIIPGSKNTIGDLSYLKKSAMADMVVSIFESNPSLRLVGICGGYQMLGKKVCDKNNIESDKRKIAGLGVLLVETSLCAKKILRQVQARHCLWGLEVYGYEIHHGVTTAVGPVKPSFEVREPGNKKINRYDGARTNDGRAWGTYMHGVFDSDKFRRHFLNELRSLKGWPDLLQGASFNAEAEISKLAQAVRRSIDIPALYRILDRGLND